MCQKGNKHIKQAVQNYWHAIETMYLTYNVTTVADPGDTFAANTFEKLKKGEASIDKEVNASITLTF